MGKITPPSSGRFFGRGDEFIHVLRQEIQILLARTILQNKRETTR